MASSSRAAISSVLSRQPSSYDVFINFRGVDTRDNFVYLLYEAFKRDGISTFIDSEELWEGEEICPSLLRAIRGSKISVPIFSKHYTDSKYCLLELAKIWDCHISDGQTVLPIFIDVEPRDVRHQTGSFQVSFQEQQKNYESTTIVNGWKNALKEVGNLKGWTLKGDANISLWEKEEAIAIWEACELQPRLAIKELIQKHLLKIDSGGCFKMHDQLQCMGKRIAMKESYDDSTKRSRLWSNDEIWKVLKEDTEIQMVEGILLCRNFESKATDLRCEDFRNMPNLRFLKLHEIDSLKGDFAHLPSKLRWFGCEPTLKILPSNFYHRELVHLDLSYNDFKWLWNDPPQNKNKFSKLKVLDLRGCHKLLISSNFFSWFPCLQRLNLNDCRSLVEIPSSICEMSFLKTLTLERCYSLKTLPTSIGDLKDLIKLSVCETKIKELPDGVGQLEKLEELDISDCHKLVRLPKSMGRMRSLHHFVLTGTKIVQLPDDFLNLSSLELLTMGRKNFECVIDGDESIILNGEELEKFNSWGCRKLREIPNLSNLQRLRKLNISYCKNLVTIHSLEGTVSLEELNGHNCYNLRGILDLSNLKRLRKLDISSCLNLEGIHGLEGTESLEELNANGCNKLREISDLSNLKRLRKLNIKNCGDLEEIHGLKEKEYLDIFNAQGCYNLTETTKKILGQGIFVNNVGERRGSKSMADDDIYHHGSSFPILCVVFAFKPWHKDAFIRMPGGLVNITFQIDADIRRRGTRMTWCSHSVVIENIKLTYRDIIYIHHCKGFDWFGYQLETKDDIHKLRFSDAMIYSQSGIPLFHDFSLKLKFWKVLFENKESDQQMPNQQSSAMLVADFFTWLDADDYEVEEEDRALRPQKRVHLLDNDDVALDNSLTLTLSTPNINDNIQGFPLDNEEAGPSIPSYKRLDWLRATTTTFPDEDDDSSVHLESD
ncbi:hypothetical protein NE237_001831 [Protea cynaroides]|uniref:TIR domain-containing protein n=1 Tax=Protea cynaroides TaxID=273540 RepID=A0A9Q0QYV9_9MAGN|nr:hypothetical protein NE237_001831 [Protea cynaroides]